MALLDMASASSPLRSPAARTLLVTVFSVLVCLLLALWSLGRQSTNMRTDLLSDARTAAKAIDWRRLKSLSASKADLASDSYQRLKEQISSIQTANPKYRFTYLLGRHPDGSVFVYVDSEQPGSRDYSAPGEIYPHAPPFLARIFATGQESVEGPIRDRFGERIGALVPVTDPRTGEILALFGMDRDAAGWNRDLTVEVTEQMALILVFALPITIYLIQRQRNERKLLESRQHFVDIIQFFPDATVVIDSQGKVSAWNRAMEELSGVKASEMLGRDDFEYALPFYGERRPILIDLVTLPEEELVGKYPLIERRGNTLVAEAYIHNAQGKKLYFYGTATALHNASGEFIGAIESIRDITERKRLEEEQGKQARLASLRAEIGAALGRNAELRPILQRCCELLVRYLDVALFRIWTLNEAEQMLEMQASAGRYTRIDGPDGRVPVTELGIGRIARERRPYHTNDLQKDPGIEDGTWREGMVAFAGDPLIVADRLVGVMAALAGTPLCEDTLAELGGIAARIAQYIERRRAEDDVVLKNMVLTTQQECSIDGILVVDDGAAIISYNTRFVEMWRIPPELVEAGDDASLLNTVVGSIIDQEGFLARVKYLYGHRGEKSREEIVLKDGRVFDRYSSPMTGPDGKYYGRVWYFRDITEKMRLEDDLRTAKDAAEEYAQRLELVLEGADVATWEWDMVTEKAILNQKYYELLGYTPGEMDTGFASFQDSIHPDDLSEVLKRVQDHTEGRTGWYQAQYRLITRSGQIRHVMSRGKIVKRDAQGRPAKVAGILTDLTEIKRLYDDVNSIHNLESIGLMAGGMSHDFNNVLNVISGNISYAKMLAAGNDAVVEPLSDAEEACERAKELGTRLQAFSVGSAPVKEEIALPAIVEGAVANVFAGSRVPVTVRAADDLLPVRADPRQIRQVLENILTNAKEALSGEGGVRIAIDNDQDGGQMGIAMESGPYVRVFLADDGKGIAQEHLPKIFDPYFSTKTTYSQRGVGLGLSICHAIMKRHRGHITVASKPGVGTEVVMYLPADAKESQPRAKESP